jgi:molybdopterin synthase catalytic subunit
MNHVKVINAWEKVMGPAVAHRTVEIKIMDQTLVVTLSSSSLRQELFMAKEKIIESLNEEVKAKVITEIVFK